MIRGDRVIMRGLRSGFGAMEPWGRHIMALSARSMCPGRFVQHYGLLMMDP